MKAQQLGVGLGPHPHPHCPVLGGLGVKVAVRRCPGDRGWRPAGSGRAAGGHVPRLRLPRCWCSGGPCAAPLALSTPKVESAKLPSSQALSLERTALLSSGPVWGLPCERAPGGPRWPRSAGPGARDPRRPQPHPPRPQQLLLRGGSWVACKMSCRV